MRSLSLILLGICSVLGVASQTSGQTTIATAPGCPALAGKHIKGMWESGRSLDLQITSVRQEGGVCIGEGSYKYGSHRGSPGGETEIIRMTVTDTMIEVELPNSKASFRIEGNKVKGSWSTKNSPQTTGGSFNLI